jgi:hypothetical protein
VGLPRARHDVWHRHSDSLVSGVYTRSCRRRNYSVCPSEYLLPQLVHILDFPTRTPLKLRSVVLQELGSEVVLVKRGGWGVLLYQLGCQAVREFDLNLSVIASWRRCEIFASFL